MFKDRDVVLHIPTGEYYTVNARPRRVHSTPSAYRLYTRLIALVYRQEFRS